MTQSSAALPPAELYLLDTNVVSALIYDPAGGVAQTYRAKLTQPGQFRAAISTVVQCELLYGVTKRPSARLKAAYELVMQHLPVLALDEQVPPHYARLRTALEQAGSPIGPNDALIAAHALALGCTLVTADAEFDRVPGLRVENWALNIWSNLHVTPRSGRHPGGSKPSGSFSHR